MAFVLRWRRYVSELSVRSAGSPLPRPVHSPRSTCEKRVLFLLVPDLHRGMFRHVSGPAVKFPVGASFLPFETLQRSSPALHTRRHKASVERLYASRSLRLFYCPSASETVKNDARAEDFWDILFSRLSRNAFTNCSVEKQLLLKRHLWKKTNGNWHSALIRFSPGIRYGGLNLDFLERWCSLATLHVIVEIFHTFKSRNCTDLVCNSVSKNFAHSRGFWSLR